MPASRLGAISFILTWPKMKTLRTVFNDWAAQAKDAYLHKQWLLSKWEVMDGVEWPQDKINILLSTIREGLQVSRNDSLVDIGCGGGWIGQGLKPDVERVVGLDISIEMLKNARRSSGMKSFVCGDACRLPIKDESFTRALCYFVFINFGNLEDINRGILEVMRILKKGGRALIGQLPDKNCSAQYDAAKKEYVEYCQKTFRGGKNIRDVCVVPVHTLEREKLLAFLDKEKISYRLRDSFNPFYRAGQPQTVSWRFDLILEKK
jgi:SAM-dependent methyltransferase